MNLTEIEDIIFYIEAHPEEWDQANWGFRTECGTTMCIAGHAVTRAGYGLVFLSGPSYRGTDSCIGPEGKFSIQYMAQLVLELTDHQANTLFSATNKLDDLKTIVKYWANGNECGRSWDDKIVDWGELERFTS